MQYKSITMDYSAVNGTTLEEIVAKTLSEHPEQVAEQSKKTLDYINKVKFAALRVTAARTRRRIIDIYVNNEFGWEKHTDYPNWFGAQGPVSVAGLAAANRPLKTVTAKGNKRKRGYSTKGYIKPPKTYPLGGRLPKGTRYKVSEDDVQIGILDNAQTKVKNKMSAFQDGGEVTSGDNEQRRKYFAAIGIYFRKNTILKAKPRPLFEPLQQKYPPLEEFREAFDAMIEDKLRVGES